MRVVFEEFVHLLENIVLAKWNLPRAMQALGKGALVGPSRCTHG